MSGLLRYVPHTSRSQPGSVLGRYVGKVSTGAPANSSLSMVQALSYGNLSSTKPQAGKLLLAESSTAALSLSTLPSSSSMRLGQSRGRHALALSTRGMATRASSKKATAVEQEDSAEETGDDLDSRARDEQYELEDRASEREENRISRMFQDRLGIRVPNEGTDMFGNEMELDDEDGGVQRRQREEELDIDAEEQYEEQVGEYYDDDDAFAEYGEDMPRDPNVPTVKERKRQLRPPQFPDDPATSKAMRQFSRTARDDTLPKELQKRINYILADAQYRKATDKHFMDQDLEIWYIANRLPSVFSITKRVLTELRARIPSFAPRSVLDFAAGCNPTLWAAREVFYHDFERFFAVERDTRLAHLGQQLATDLGIQMTYRARLVPGSDHPQGGYDLVVASYALSKQPNDDYRRALLETLWGLTNPNGGLLLLLEDSRDFDRIRTGRDYLLKTYPPSNNVSNATVTESLDKAVEEGKLPRAVANRKKAKQLLAPGASSILPCAHDKPCPIAAMQRLYDETIKIRAAARKEGTAGIKLPRVPVKSCSFGHRVLRGPMPNQSPLKDIKVPPHLGDAILHSFSYVVMRRGNPDLSKGESASYLAAQEGFEGPDREVNEEEEEEGEEVGEREEGGEDGETVNNAGEGEEVNANTTVQSSSSSLTSPSSASNMIVSSSSSSSSSSSLSPTPVHSPISTSQEKPATPEEEDAARGLAMNLFGARRVETEDALKQARKNKKSQSAVSTAAEQEGGVSTSAGDIASFNRAEIRKKASETLQYDQPIRIATAAAALGDDVASATADSDIPSSLHGVPYIEVPDPAEAEADADAVQEPQVDPRELFASSRWARVVSPPIKRGGHVLLDLCTPQGAIERRIIGRDGVGSAGYRQARGVKWGDVWPYNKALRTSELFTATETPEEREQREETRRRREEIADLFSPYNLEGSALDAMRMGAVDAELSGRVNGDVDVDVDKPAVAASGENAANNKAPGRANSAIVNHAAPPISASPSAAAASTTSTSHPQVPANVDIDVDADIAALEMELASALGDELSTSASTSMSMMTSTMTSTTATSSSLSTPSTAGRGAGGRAGEAAAVKAASVVGKPSVASFDTSVKEHVSTTAAQADQREQEEESTTVSQSSSSSSRKKDRANKGSSSSTTSSTSASSSESPKAALLDAMSVGSLDAVEALIDARLKAARKQQAKRTAGDVTAMTSARVVASSQQQQQQQEGQEGGETGEERPGERVRKSSMKGERIDVEVMTTEQARRAKRGDSVDDDYSDVAVMSESSFHQQQSLMNNGAAHTEATTSTGRPSSFVDVSAGNETGLTTSAGRSGEEGYGSSPVHEAVMRAKKLKREKELEALAEALIADDAPIFTAEEKAKGRKKAIDDAYYLDASAPDIFAPPSVDPLAMLQAGKVGKLATKPQQQQPQQPQQQVEQPKPTPAPAPAPAASATSSSTQPSSAPSPKPPVQTLQALPSQQQQQQQQQQMRKPFVHADNHIMTAAAAVPSQDAIANKLAVKKPAPYGSNSRGPLKAPLPAGSIFTPRNLELEEQDEYLSGLFVRPENEVNKDESSTLLFLSLPSLYGSMGLLS